MSDVHLCRFLRWKGQYGVSWRSEDHLARSMAGSPDPFSCLHTCRNWGPDDSMVAPERCAPERKCFERSPRSPPPPAQS